MMDFASNRLVFFEEVDHLPTFWASQVCELPVCVITDRVKRGRYWTDLSPTIIVLDRNDSLDQLSDPLQGRRRIVIDDAAPVALSRLLCKFESVSNIKIHAPLTPHFYRNRPAFLNSVPKCGTHLLAHCLEIMGFTAPENDGRPDLAGRFVPGTYYHMQHMRVEQLSSQYHEIRGFIDAFSRSVAVFITRDPRDVIVSLSNYVPLQAEYHLLCQQWQSMSPEQRMLCIING